MHICATMNFRMTHFFWEDNNSANRLTNLSAENRIEFSYFTL